MDATKNLLKAVEDGNTDDLNTQLNTDPKIFQKFSLLPKKDTPLHIAASVGNLDLVKLIIEKKPSFAWDKNEYGLTPLHIASALGHLEIVKTLLGVGSASLCRLQDDQGRTPLHYAAMNGETDVLKSLAEECPETLATLTTDKETPLHLALKNKKQDTITAFVEALDCYKKSIFNRWFSINQLAKETNRPKIFYFQNGGCLPRLGLDSLLPNFTSLTDEKTLQVVATLIATMSFQAAARPPVTIWKQDMKLNYRCITAMESVTSLLHCPALNYLLFLFSNSAGFFFSSLLLLTFREGVIAEVLLRASLACLLFSYVILLISMTFDDYSLGSIGGFLFIILYAVLLFDWLKMKIYLCTKRTPQNQDPNSSNTNTTSNMGNEQASAPVPEHRLTTSPNIRSPETTSSEGVV